MSYVDKNLALRLSEPIEAAYLDAVDALIINIARHLGTGKAFRTASWEVQKLSELGKLSEENAKIINEAVKRVPDEIRKALDEASAAPSGPRHPPGALSCARPGRTRPGRDCEHRPAGGTGIDLF